MMHAPKYRYVSALEPGMASRFPGPRPGPLHSESGGEQSVNDPGRDTVITIDDCIQLAQELTSQLNMLGGYKHPLAVRKWRKEVRNVTDEDKKESQQIRAGSRTYFVDIETTKGEGKRYLKITESRFKGDGKERERNTIIVFPENVKEFVKVVSEMGAKLG